MGAWGFEAFENDDAMDWVYELEETSDLSAVKTALQRIANAQDEYVEAPDCSIAVAAAEVVAALKSKPSQGCPEEVANWLAQHPLQANNELIALAQRAVARVKAASELKDLWDESDDADNWYQSLDNIEARLGR